MSECSTVVEQWRAVPGHEGSYEVSDRGRVRSLPRCVTYKGGTPRKLQGKIMKTPVGSHGYPAVTLSLCGVRYTYCVHELVLIAFVGSPLEGQECLHNSRDKSNVCLPNFRWGTHSENELDKVRHGTSYQLNKVQCPLDHRLMTPNLVASVSALGRRGCLACARARGEVQHAKRRGRTIDFATAANRHYERIMHGSMGHVFGRRQPALQPVGAGQ